MSSNVNAPSHPTVTVPTDRNGSRSIVRAVAGIPRRAGIALLCLLGTFAAAGSASAADTLRLEAKIPLGAVAGRIDHLAIDLNRGRLYVAELGNNSLGVVDVKSRRLLRTITGFSEPQGVLYLPSRDQVYVADAGDGTVHILDGGDLSTVQKIALGSDADNIRLDPTTGQAVVGYGSGALAPIDPASRSKGADIALPGHPESFRFDGAGSRAFVNVPDAREITVIDVANRKVSAHWPQNDTSNFAMAMDEAGGQVIVAFRSPPALAFLDRNTGAVRQRVPTCEDVDDLFVDARRQRVYVICGAGGIDVFAAGQGGFAPIGRISTARGARTGLLVPELDEMFVAVPATAQEPAAIWVFRPQP